MYLPILRVHFKKKKKQRKIHQIMFVQCFCIVFFFLIFFFTHNICLYKEVDTVEPR